MAEPVERCVMCGGKMHPGTGHKMGPKRGGPWVVCEDCGAQAPTPVAEPVEDIDALTAELVTTAEVIEAGDLIGNMNDADPTVLRAAAAALVALRDDNARLTAERDELAEQLASLRAGCLNLTREELIQRITAIGPEHWRQGVWLDTQLAPVRAERDHWYQAAVDERGATADAVGRAERAEAERDALARWKAEAEAVQNDWINVWVALGKPGVLGESLAHACEQEIAKLQGRDR